jgi:hypothetical protein
MVPQVPRALHGLAAELNETAALIRKALDAAAGSEKSDKAPE